MAWEVAGFEYFMALFGFIFVFVLAYALLIKSKMLGDNNIISFIVAVVIAIIFSSLTSAQNYLQTATPWVAVLMVLLFFVTFIVSMGPHKVESIVKPEFIWVIVGLLVVVFIISAVYVFPDVFKSIWDGLKDFANTQAKIASAIIFLIIAGIVAWAITKK